MIAVDTNILLYAHRRQAPFHEEAARCLERLAGATAPWAIPWPCIHEFLAVSSNPRLFPTPPRLEQSVAQVEEWLRAPTLVLLAEGASHWAELRKLLLAGRVVGPAVHDARIAAICLAHDVEELWTADRDFNRFPGLRARNPLVGP